MTPHQRDFLLTQICSGEVNLRYNGKNYFYRYPNASIKYRANLKYQEVINDSTELLTQADMLKHFNWSERLQEEIDVHIPKVMDNLRVDIYFSVINNNPLFKSLKEKMGKVKERLVEVLNIKHRYDEYTLEGLAEKQKVIYLIKKCVRKLDVYPENLLTSYYESLVSENSIRELARSGEWMVKWLALKKGLNIFYGNPTEDQEKLIRWTTLYENILEGQNPPPDNVLEDDDAFDGFLIHRRQENERADSLDELDRKIGDKYKGGSCEVYLPAKDIEEAKRINLMNSPDAVKIKENRFAQIEKMGVVKQAQLQDERIKIEMAINRMNT